VLYFLLWGKIALVDIWAYFCSMGEVQVEQGRVPRNTFFWWKQSNA
jgi:hypothetical protein